VYLKPPSCGRRKGVFNAEANNVGKIGVLVLGVSIFLLRFSGVFCALAEKLRSSILSSS
jgi:hypothetical protein